MLKNNPKTRLGGFTLIELLVVISIISFLASIMTASAANAKQRAQDAKIHVAQAQIKTAVELYYGDNDAYPGDDGSGEIQYYCVGGTDCIYFGTPIGDQLPGLNLATISTPSIQVGSYRMKGFIYVVCPPQVSTCPQGTDSPTSYLVTTTYGDGITGQTVGRWEDVLITPPPLTPTPPPPPGPGDDFCFISGGDVNGPRYFLSSEGGNSLVDYDYCNDNGLL